MIECTNLTKSYNKKCIVENLSFKVNKGEIFAFLGSNGAGKTTTIKMILGLVLSVVILPLDTFDMPLSDFLIFSVFDILLSQFL